MHQARTWNLNEADRRVDGGRYVLYWMQASQRAQDNLALERAIQIANELGQPCLVGFGLTADYPEARWPHYFFMLEGLRKASEHLAARGIKLVVREGDPAQVALALGEGASVIVTDRGYLRHQVAWRERVAREADCEVVQVEDNVVVPVDLVSDKREYAARTIRKKLWKHVDDCRETLGTRGLDRQSLPLREKGIDLQDIGKTGKLLGFDGRRPSTADSFTGGTSAAKRLARRFLEEGLEAYADKRSDPTADAGSRLSPYLHFGQVSPLWLLDQLSDRKGEGKDGFLEELIVRRELAVNFVRFEKDYDKYSCLPDWAKTTLDEHRNDDREAVYSKSQLECAETDDAVWNAAMREMKTTGYLHNQLRMYWGKQILRWSNTPEHAYRTALDLNNRYFLDGRDPNSFANVGWLFGLHDRPWPKHSVFGKVRTMTRSGLERKMDVEEYLRKAEGESSQ